MHVETTNIILSKHRITKALIRLCGYAGRSAPLLFAYGKNRFSHDSAPIFLFIHLHDSSTHCRLFEGIKNSLHQNVRKKNPLYSLLHLLILNEPARNKTNKMTVCAQQRLRTAWAIAQSDQSLRCALNG